MVMFGVVASAPGTMQKLMEEILKDHVYKRCIVFIDDALVYTERRAGETEGGVHEATYGRCRLPSRPGKKAKASTRPSGSRSSSKETSFCGAAASTTGHDRRASRPPNPIKHA